MTVAHGAQGHGLDTGLCWKLWALVNPGREHRGEGGCVQKHLKLVLSRNNNDINNINNNNNKTTS